MRKSRTPPPDAWANLVLRTMSTEEITQVLQSGEESDPLKIQWLKNELLKRRAGSLGER